MGIANVKSKSFARFCSDEGVGSAVDCAPRRKKDQNKRREPQILLRQRKRNRSPASFLDKERKAGSRPWQSCLRVYDLILILYPQGGETSGGIELQAVGIEAKSVALCSLPGSQLRASLSRNLYELSKEERLKKDNSDKVPWRSNEDRVEENISGQPVQGLPGIEDEVVLQKGLIAELLEIEQAGAHPPRSISNDAVLPPDLAECGDKYAASTLLKSPELFKRIPQHFSVGEMLYGPLIDCIARDIGS
ncbi:hypothetical protein LguiB_035972 [Lonicera macranthoides]